MPRLAETELTAEQREVYDRIASGPRGAVQGPLRIWLKSPRLADRAQTLGAFCRYGSSLEPRLSELAIITVGAYWKSGFEWAAHAPLARDAGVSLAVIEAVKGLEASPPFERDDERIIYDFSRELLTGHLVSNATFERALSSFGETEIVDLVGILGYYTLICMTINAFEVESMGDERFS